MFWKMKSPRRELPSGLWVTAIDMPERKPLIDMERWIQTALRTQGSLRLHDLCRLVAECLYCDALEHGAAAVDIGLFGIRLFSPEAAAVVAGGDGQWWTIGKAADNFGLVVRPHSEELATHLGMES